MSIRRFYKQLTFAVIFVSPAWAQQQSISQLVPAQDVQALIEEVSSDVANLGQNLNCDRVVKSWVEIRKLKLKIKDSAPYRRVKLDATRLSPACTSVAIGDGEMDPLATELVLIPRIKRSRYMTPAEKQRCIKHWADRVALIKFISFEVDPVIIKIEQKCQSTGNWETKVYPAVREDEPVNIGR